MNRSASPKRRVSFTRKLSDQLRGSFDGAGAELRIASSANRRGAHGPGHRSWQSDPGAKARERGGGRLLEPPGELLDSTEAVVVPNGTYVIENEASCRRLFARDIDENSASFVWKQEIGAGPPCAMGNEPEDTKWNLVREPGLEHHYTLTNAQSNRRLFARKYKGEAARGVGAVPGGEVSSVGVGRPR